jgi:hypothetical protein
MGLVMAQEGFTKWNQIESTWKQLKDKFAFRPTRLSGDDSESFNLIRAEISRIGQSDESKPASDLSPRRPGKAE